MPVSAVDFTLGALTDSFDQSPFASKTTVLPEKQLIEWISQQQKDFENLMTLAKPTPSQVINPQTMLAIQYGIMQAVLPVDVTVKLFASLTQTVNRLATMQ